MSTTEVGRIAEDTAAKFLEDQGYRIVARNWRNKWCEIDIVAEKAGEIHIVEVKYRQHTSFGGGLEAITANKVVRLQKAAQAWAARSGYDGVLQIDAVIIGQGMDCRFEPLIF
jgi:putative endonuclease